MLATVHQPLAHGGGGSSAAGAALALVADLLRETDAPLAEELAHSGVLTVRLDRRAEVWVGVDMRARPARDADSLKVLVVIEPPAVQSLCTDGFDLVLTWWDEHLRALPAARLFLAATPWLVPGEWAPAHAPKRPGVGFLRGAKRRTEGHRLRHERPAVAVPPHLLGASGALVLLGRGTCQDAADLRPKASHGLKEYFPGTRLGDRGHEIWEAREQLERRAGVPVDFEAGGGVSRADRNRQFSYQFVLVVENSRHRNYFTEKLLDALLSRCIPVYWGCPNIADFFEEAGLVVVGDGGSLSDVEVALGALSEAAYAARLESAEENFERARPIAAVATTVSDERGWGKGASGDWLPALGLPERKWSDRTMNL
ncbi:unnamed protein product [Prorocentrum cordatum]|uniref:Fucosyltransferase n=1 Tax=Prorocentrum cordatum TaxID=2364126 RepID=A0ABN9T3I5_9DINO|nr:unnamed protein product [Polarella glacialis]